MRSLCSKATVPASEVVLAPEFSLPHHDVMQKDIKTILQVSLKRRQCVTLKIHHLLAFLNVLVTEYKFPSFLISVSVNYLVECLSQDHSDKKEQGPYQRGDCGMVPEREAFRKTRAV